MRKSKIPRSANPSRAGGEDGWLDIPAIAEVEFSSESADSPVEKMFEAGSGGWRASAPGPQTLRLIFDSPRTIREIYLRISESEKHRTQELALSWAAGRDGPAREIVRQQWNFSPDGSTEEVERYAVELRGAVLLVLDLNPDISGPGAVASVAEWKVR